MRILDIQTAFENGTAAVTARVRPDGTSRPLDLWYRFDGVEGVVDGVGESLAVGLVAACMAEAEPLAVEAPVSRAFLDNVATAQQVLSSWYDYLTSVQVSAAIVAEGRADHPPAGGVGCCFTAGVDSWYSLLKNERRISHLILVRGFDVGLDNDVLWRQARSRIAGVAERLGKRLVTCETNLRSIADKRRCRWGRAFAGDFWGESLHGSALASVALMLQGELAEVIIPATHTYRQIKPWGSSPLLDPSWSTDRLRFTHDGCEADRVEKTRRVAASDLALASLRVCHDDTASYNCGRCEKCLRTMMALRLCGALGRASTFPDGLSLAEVRRLIVPRHLIHRYDELIREARRVGDDTVLHAIEAALGRRFSAPHALAVVRSAVRSSALGGWLKSRLRRPRKATPGYAACRVAPAATGVDGCPE